MNVSQKVGYASQIQNNQIKQQIQETLKEKNICQNLISNQEIKDEDLQSYLNWNSQRKTDWQLRTNKISKITLSDKKNENKIIFESYKNENNFDDFARIQKNLMIFNKKIDCLIVDQQTIFDDKNEDKFLDKYEDYFFDITEEIPVMNLTNYLSKQDFDQMSYMFVNKNQTVIKNGMFQKLFDKQAAGFDLYLNVFGLIMQRDLIKKSGKIMLSDFCNQENLQIYFNDLNLQKLEQINQGSKAFNLLSYLHYLSDSKQNGCYQCSENLKRLEIELDLMISMFTNKIDENRGELIAKQIFGVLSEKQNKTIYSILPFRLLPYILKVFQKIAIEQRIVGSNIYKFERERFIVNKFSGDLKTFFIDHEEIQRKRAISYSLIGLNSPNNADTKFQQKYDEDFRQLFESPAQIFLNEQNNIDCGAVKMITSKNQLNEFEKPEFDQELLNTKSVNQKSNQDQNPENKNLQNKEKILPKFRFKKKKSK